MLKNLHPSVSIIIKALNEERHIASAIESALTAVAGMDGEVILADSASTDRTVEIARRYPIKIVRLNNVEDRSCGAGTQLGFQHSRGQQYVCHMDGDMQLRDGFLPAAIQFLEENPAMAGVGGLNIDRELSNLEFAQRARRHDPDGAPGTVTRLNGCGVYRRAAIESIGYLTDRNLHGGEELDLGARLHSRGWKLARLERPAIDHYGHIGNAYRLLLRRFRTRNSFGTGEAIRAAIARRHFAFMVLNDRNFMLCSLVVAWWFSIAATPVVLSGVPAVFAIGAIFLFPFAVMSLRWRSVGNGLYSVAAWNVLALCFLPGFTRSRVSPTRWIDSTVVKDVPSPSARSGIDPELQRDWRACGTPTTTTQLN
jgi:glycosyltransferase involved in cell wall biosynthesis